MYIVCDHPICCRTYYDSCSRQGYHIYHRRLLDILWDEDEKGSIAVNSLSYTLSIWCVDSHKEARPDQGNSITADAYYPVVIHVVPFFRGL